MNIEVMGSDLNHIFSKMRDFARERGKCPTTFIPGELSCFVTCKLLYGHRFEVIAYNGIGIVKYVFSFLGDDYVDGETFVLNIETTPKFAAKEEYSLSREGEKIIIDGIDDPNSLMTAFDEHEQVRVASLEDIEERFISPQRSSIYNSEKNMVTLSIPVLKKLLDAAGKKDSITFYVDSKPTSPVYYKTYSALCSALSADGIICPIRKLGDL